MIGNEHILFETDTDFEHYQVVDRLYEGRQARVLFSGPRRAAQSGIGLDDDPDLLFDYNQRLLEIANALYPARILVIGGGAFTLPSALVTALPDSRIDVVELDPELLPIAKNYFGLYDSDRLTVTFGDGRQFIAQTKEKYDLIILDVFSDLVVPRQFLTAEFIAQMHGLLRKGGAVAMNIIASYQGRNMALIRSQIAGYQRSFDAITIFPAAHGISTWLPQNMIIVAQDGPLKALEPYVRFAPLQTLQVTEDDMYYDAKEGLLAN